jgi:hypothetical protein
MGTAAIYNGFGRYETNDKGEQGITLTHGGVPFWFPFKQVTYIPDYTMREVDHRESSADGDAESTLVYKTFRLSGQRIAEELLETQIPVKNSDKGIILLTTAKKKDTYLTVPAGVSEEGQRLMAEVQEVAVSDADRQEAARRAMQFKQDTIRLYFQSKRERMAGGHGQLFPTGLLKAFMEELEVNDIDDVFVKKQNDTAVPAWFQQLMAMGSKQYVAPEVPVTPPPPVPPAAKGAQKQAAASLV